MYKLLSFDAGAGKNDPHTVSSLSRARYREIGELSLEEAFENFGVVGGTADLIERYFELFPEMQLYPDVLPTGRYRLAVVSNIDDDLLAATRLYREFDLVCTAERAGGYKPDGTLFRYLIANAGVAVSEILHSGQSQFTDMVGGKPLSLTVCWITGTGRASRKQPDAARAGITRYSRFH